MSLPPKSPSVKVTNSVSVAEPPKTALEKTVDLTLRFLNDNQYLVRLLTAENKSNLRENSVSSLYRSYYHKTVMKEIVLLVSMINNALNCFNTHAHTSDLGS